MTLKNHKHFIEQFLHTKKYAARFMKIDFLCYSKILSVVFQFSDFYDIFQNDLYNLPGIVWIKAREQGGKLEFFQA